MEYMIEQGFVQGVLDMNTHELIAESNPDAKGIYTPLRPRMVEAGKRGVPQIVSPGSIEYFCFGAPGSYPDKFNGRLTHYHNPYNTNIRADLEELSNAAKMMAERLNASTGKVAVLLPLKGFSNNGKEGGPLHDPETDNAFLDEFTRLLKPEIEVVKIDANINDPMFADKTAERMDMLVCGN